MGMRWFIPSAPMLVYRAVWRSQTASPQRSGFEIFSVCGPDVQPGTWGGLDARDLKQLTVQDEKTEQDSRRARSLYQGRNGGLLRVPYRHGDLGWFGFTVRTRDVG